MDWDTSHVEKRIKKEGYSREEGMQFLAASVTGKGEVFKCLWCEYSTKGVDSIRSHLCVHLDYFPLQCMVCDHWLPSQLMFNFHCQLKDHPADSQASEVRDQTKEERIGEMLDQVIGEAMRPQASESLYTRTERATPDNDLKHGGSVNDFSFFNHPPDLPEFSTSSFLDDDDQDDNRSQASTSTASTIGRRLRRRRKNQEGDGEQMDEAEAERVKTKHLCAKCRRGYVLSGIVKHVWKHIADEKKMVPFACEGIDCSFATYSTNAALHHHKTVHRRNPEAQIADYRDECGPVFEECLSDWFDLSKEDSEELLNERYG